jgi:hypothetical protein
MSEGDPIYEGRDHVKSCRQRPSVAAQALDDICRVRWHDYDGTHNSEYKKEDYNDNRNIDHLRRVATT